MSQTLVLVPTFLEAEVLFPTLARRHGDSLRLELCGFGPVAAAARTAELLAGFGKSRGRPFSAEANPPNIDVFPGSQPPHPAVEDVSQSLSGMNAPERVLLLGIAGRFDERLAICAAYQFHKVACWGVGVGSGADFIPAGSLGWQQWPGDPATGEPAIGDVIGDLLADSGKSLPPQDAAMAMEGFSHGQLRPLPGGSVAGLLLTACAASADHRDLALRRTHFPDAMAEDMEGFAVAMACRLAGVPLEIIRGISNTAGDREPAHWQTKPALEAAATLALERLEAAS